MLTKFVNLLRACVNHGLLYCFLLFLLVFLFVLDGLLERPWLVLVSRNNWIRVREFTWYFRRVLIIAILGVYFGDLLLVLHLLQIFHEPHLLLHKVFVLHQVLHRGFLLVCLKIHHKQVFLGQLDFDILNSFRCRRLVHDVPLVSNDCRHAVRLDQEPHDLRPVREDLNRLVVEKVPLSSLRTIVTLTSYERQVVGASETKHCLQLVKIC